MLSTRTIVILSLAYTAPLILYACTFGPNLSDSHERWAEFGSAMAGIYAPIVALSTLAILIRQTRLQRDINIHQYDQAFVQQARADIDFYTTNLARTLRQEALPNISVRKFLQTYFQPPELKQDDPIGATMRATELDKSVPEVMATWAAIYTIIAGLEAPERQPYQVVLSSSLQRMIASLSFEICVCLDNYHHARCGGTLKPPYKFSPLLMFPSAA